MGAVSDVGRYLIDVYGVDRALAFAAEAAAENRAAGRPVMAAEWDRVVEEIPNIRRGSRG